MDVVIITIIIIISISINNITIMFLVRIID